jgi:CHAD domain-containing protein
LREKRSKADICDEDLDIHETVHEVRKRCKKVRGLLRLIRPTCEDTYEVENAHFRDSARILSETRDATTLIESFDALVRRFSEESGQETMPELRRLLVEHREKVAPSRAVEERLDRFRGSMREVRIRIVDWPLDSDDLVTVFAAGFKKTYGRARNAMKAARAEPTNERLHEWRKRVKYHRYHVALLRDMWPPILKGRRGAVKKLTDLLGDDHDLAVLGETLSGEPERSHARETVERFRDLCEARRRELQVWAFLEGRKLFTDKPKDWKHRVERWWGAWKEEKEFAYALGEHSREVYS